MGFFVYYVKSLPMDMGVDSEDMVTHLNRRFLFKLERKRGEAPRGYITLLKQSAAATKRQWQRGVEVGGTSGGVEAGGTSGGAEDVAGGDGNSPEVFNGLPQWLVEYNLDDIPLETSGASHSSVKAQLADIRQQQIEM
ncbi:hypothetical protein LIER_17629 [Lithospermum erythrorhizon]|uniref:Uncharacterized protein n=1 Tax=Lithospermum erythrorhizon TaxID=34254 RepID=A0AAV3QE99_LITER